MDEFQEQKVGGGIKTVAIIQFVFQGIALLGFIMLLAMKDTLEAMPGGEALAKLTTGAIVLSLVIVIIEAISLILILMKNKIGVFIYFGIYIISFIYGIITAGFSISTVIGLILPGLMAYFIYEKREIFGFKSNNDSY